jgi:TolA-binding protein
LAARPAVAGDAPSAAALLAEAGRARGEGQRDRAAALYRRLQREFPGTPEALVSVVPLGRLLLDGGAARPALAAFDGYLRDVPRGPLVAEALYGKGRALESLGDRDEERRTWERLLSDHAGSAYAPHAQRRLAALR